MRIVVLAALTTVLLAGCATATPAATPTAKAPAALSGTITVDAASSLTGTFDTVGAVFTKANPGVTVTFNYGGSGALAAAIVAGAPVDVFAAASPATMALVTTPGLAATPHTFVKNELEIAVPAGNPGKITGLKDFADASKKIALCDPAQPCGAAAQAVFTAAHITPQPDTLTADVKSAVTDVSLDEVDAAMVYHTDVLAGGAKVTGITFPEASSFIVSYPIAALKSAPNSKAAAAFVAFVLGAKAQAILGHAGFITK